MRLRARAAILVSVTALLLMAGCGSGPEQDRSAGDDGTTPTRTAIAVTADQACPPRLAKASAETHGFGRDEPAASVPTLPMAESGWVCQYWPSDGPSAPNGGATFVWTRRAAPQQVSPDELGMLADALAGLKPIDRRMPCTADLGSRYVLSYTNGDELTSVVVDGFGCGSVRLTEDPANVVSGESTDSRLVSGVLSAPPGLHGQLKRLAGSPDAGK